MSDEGIYRCEAENKHGSAKTQATAHVDSMFALFIVLEFLRLYFSGTWKDGEDQARTWRGTTLYYSVRGYDCESW